VRGGDAAVYQKKMNDYSINPNQKGLFKKANQKGLFKKANQKVFASIHSKRLTKNKMQL
jgi:hypothetical protein